MEGYILFSIIFFCDDCQPIGNYREGLFDFLMLEQTIKPRRFSRAALLLALRRLLLCLFHLLG
jgi:hypothetical protein